MKKLILLLICLSMLFCSSCSLFEDDGSGYVFKLSLLSDPKNLDPQIANDISSIAVSENIFARLIKYNSDGSLSPWVADDYEISDSKLRYTFYLNKDYKWKASGDFSADLTAYDFVYAFRRLLDPATESIHAKSYYCIKNAEEINLGNLSVDDLGVFAENEYTLVIDLEYENPMFLYLMSMLPASPCNEEFFISCKGKYGLEADCIASNGPFYVRYWLHEQYGTDNYVRLTRNADYSEISRVYPSGVTFLINKIDVKLKNFTSQATDILLLNDFTAVSNESDYTLSQQSYGTFGFVFNESNELFARSDVRALFSMSVDRYSLYDKSGDILSEGYSLYPYGVNVLGTSLAYGNKSIFEYDKAMAEYKWNFLLTQEEKNTLHSKSILVPDIFGEYNSLRAITTGWNDILGIPFGIEVVNMTDYAERIESGKYDIALVLLSSSTGDARDYIMPFSNEATYHFTVTQASNAVGSYSNGVSLNSYVYDCLEAQRAILEDFHFIPLFEIPTRCYYSEDILDLSLNYCNGVINFEKAKHY